jgi:hypothetical protein
MVTQNMDEALMRGVTLTLLGEVTGVERLAKDHCDAPQPRQDCAWRHRLVGTMQIDGHNRNGEVV